MPCSGWLAQGALPCPGGIAAGISKRCHLPPHSQAGPACLHPTMSLAYVPSLFGATGPLGAVVRTSRVSPELVTAVNQGWAVAAFCSMARRQEAP